MIPNDHVNAVLSSDNVRYTFTPDSGYALWIDNSPNVDPVTNKPLFYSSSIDISASQVEKIASHIRAKLIENDMEVF